MTSSSYIKRLFHPEEAEYAILSMTYTQKQIFKPIEVITYFHNLKVDILKFKWDSRVYRVNRIANTWRIPDNEEGFKSHYTVICDDAGIICELSYFHKSMKWELVQYDTLD